MRNPVAIGLALAVGVGAVTFGLAGCGGDNDTASGVTTPATGEETASTTTPATPTAGSGGEMVKITVASRTDGSGDSGTFEVTGAITDSGKFVTAQNRAEGGLNRTLKGKQGNIVLHLAFVELTEPRVSFTWTVASGSGAYGGLRGEGEGEDRFYEGERFGGTSTGTVRR